MAQVSVEVGCIFRLRESGSEFIFSPKVPGCGFVDGGRADLLIGPLVLEVKSGERNFRVVDLRQVLIYAALFNLATPRRISAIALVNPRRGVFYEAPCEDVCEAAGGAPAGYCFSQIVEFMSGTFSSV
jgi:hypothetical protein